MIGHSLHFLSTTVPTNDQEHSNLLINLGDKNLGDKNLGDINLGDINLGDINLGDMFKQKKQKTIPFPGI